MATKKKDAVNMPEQRLSYNALRVIGGRISEECNSDLSYPRSIDTYKMMFKDATIAPAMTYMEMSIAQAEWDVKAPEGCSEETKKRTEIIRSMMHDMESTWTDFIRNAATHNRYGFAPVEKIYRKRLKKNGSRWDDGVYGIANLVLIAQDSVDGWRFDESGRKVLGIEQTANKPTNKNDIYGGKVDEVFIPRNKFMLFRADPQKDSPIGTSPLNAVYVAWRYKTELEKFESMGISNDLRGFKVIKIPPRYMADDASEDEKKTLEIFKEILRSIHNGEQSGVLLPQQWDENGKPLFEFDVKSIMGQAAHDINGIITRYKKEIVSGILAPLMMSGQDGGGSFALTESLKDITDLVVVTRLKEIREVLNHDLIPQIYQVNGWDMTEMPKFTYEDFTQVTLDELSKTLQRIASVGGLVLGAEQMNWIHEQVGLPAAFQDVEITIEEAREVATGDTSRAGDGMDVGKFSGTSDKVSEQDNSISNMEN